MPLPSAAPPRSPAAAARPARPTSTCRPAAATKFVGQALEAAGAGFADVVRTRIILTDIAPWRETARAHADVFADIRPATTVMAVAAFVDPDWLVEIEVDAIV